jgi:hypothetical protein
MYRHETLHLAWIMPILPGSDTHDDGALESRRTLRSTNYPSSPAPGHTRATGPSSNKEPMPFLEECTTHRSKLFGSHGQRPWV